MNTSFERSANATDEWYTPKEIVDACGKFDLDPCSPEHRLWDTATRHITPSEDGLKSDWGGKGYGSILLTADRLLSVLWIKWLRITTVLRFSLTDAIARCSRM